MTHLSGQPPILEALRLAYDTAREMLQETPPVTGMRWTRPARRCPDWCARSHQCTAQHGYPSGEHRSPLNTWNRPYGRITAQRILPITGGVSVNLTSNVRLSNDGNLGLAQAINLPLVVNEAIKTLLVELELEHAQRTAIENYSRLALGGRTTGGHLELTGGF